ncbi:MAG TPA: DUF692 domain-containing protein [Albitalea sp.]|nr:DUF692 domain-containing protein [Albitalea sp.]
MSPSAAPHAGIGLRQPHYAQFLERRPALGFIEVHSENFFAEGGAALAVLQQARAHYALSLHGVGLGLGSAAGLDDWHLERLERLVQRTAPERVSDHAAFARAPRTAGQPAVHANDLLPIGFNPASLDILCANVARVQERLRRPILVENVSAYLSYADDTLAEAEFFAALCRRSGCGMLLDVNNLMVNALNAAEPDPLAACCAFIDRLPHGIVGEIHLAGYCETEDIVIDDHGSRVRPSVWSAYAHAVHRFGAVPTLIEWDTDVPALDVLLDEAARADRVLREVLG